MRISSTSDPTAAKTGVTNTFTEPQIISVTLPDFPRVTLLDDFNRPGSGLGTNWSASTVYTAGTLALIGSGIVELQADQSAAMYWNSAYFGPDFDVVVEIADGLQADFAEVDILFRSANLEVTPRSNGGVYYYGGPDYWGCGIWNYPDGVYTNLVDLDILSAPVNPALGARVYGNTVELWIRDDGVWTKMSTQTFTMDLTTSFRIAVGFYDTLGSEIKVTSFSAQDLPDILTFESDSSPVARISAGGIVVPSASTASAGDSFSVGDPHTFTAQQTFNPTNSDPAIVAEGDFQLTGELVVTDTTLALNVTGPSEITGTTRINPDITASDGSAKRVLDITPSIALNSGSNNSTEVTGINNEVVLSSSSTYKPSFFNALFSVIRNTHATLKPDNGYAGYFLGQSEGAGGFSLLAVIRAALGLSSGTTVNEAIGIRVEGTDASAATVSYLAGIEIGYQRGATTNYALRTRGGENFLETGAAATKALVLRGAASQSANMLEVQDSAGTVLAYIDSAGNLIQSVQTLTDAANVDWNLKLGGYASLTIGGNRTLNNPTNMIAGGSYTLKITQDGAGSRTLGFGSAYKWVGGTPDRKSVV